MRAGLTLLFTTFLFIFLYIVFYKGLNKSNLYEPKSEIEFVPRFSAETFFSKEKLASEEIFNQKKFYLFNIWASWCVPCRAEHPFLMDLSEISQLNIVGLNYKDNFENAEEFIKELGNPFSKILIDRDGANAIEWGAYGVPETFLIYESKILKRFIGPLSSKNVEEIKKFLNEYN